MNRTLTVYNSLTRQKEEFKPLVEGHTGMYVCGPTVYSDVHLGNCRTFVSFDIIYRYLLRLGLQVRYVRNITDVGHLTGDSDAGEDKMSKAARLANLEPMEVAQKYANGFHAMMRTFNTLEPSIEPHATGHIPEQIEMVQAILDNGFAYDRSKAAGEREALKGVHHGLEVIVFNPTAVIGPYDYWNAYSGQLLRDLMRGRLPALVRGGFDWADARDLAAATLAALNGGRSGERYILSGHWASARRLAELCAVHSGKNPALPELPIWAALLGLPFLRLYSRLSGRRPLYTYESIMVLKHSNRNCSHEKARRELGYAPRPLEETIRDIYEWYKREGFV